MDIFKNKSKIRGLCSASLSPQSIHLAVHDCVANNCVLRTWAFVIKHIVITKIFYKLSRSQNKCNYEHTVLIKLACSHDMHIHKMSCYPNINIR